MLFVKRALLPLLLLAASALATTHHIDKVTHVKAPKDTFTKVHWC